MYDILPDSVYFKLKAPDGVGASDRLQVWLYDPRNSNWDNAIYYELNDLQILQDKQWHQFSVSLWDFKVNVAEPDYTNIIAISIERPIADENSEFPLMYIDHVWIGLPDIAAVKEKTQAASMTCSLDQNYPNPFNPITTITFELSIPSTTILSIYNIAGDRVAEWKTDYLPAGRHSYQWNAEGFPSGAYFYQIKSGEFFQTHKMLLVR
ncbi:MAG: T9SS C-terminal target domain-containing protein [Calditrichaeota bacterium]|nr:MAG: T9SS C-terminal target domain-containing protein [Calditrichota bacterium]